VLQFEQLNRKFVWNDFSRQDRKLIL